MDVKNECEKYHINKLYKIVCTGKTQLETIFNSVNAIKKDFSMNDKIVIGQFVGIEGSTGQVTGKHLHLEEQDLSSGRNWNFSTNILNFFLQNLSCLFFTTSSRK